MQMTLKLRGTGQTGSGPLKKGVKKGSKMGPILDPLFDPFWPAGPNNDLNMNDSGPHLLKRGPKRGSKRGQKGVKKGSK